MNLKKIKERLKDHWKKHKPEIIILIVYSTPLFFLLFGLLPEAYNYSFRLNYKSLNFFYEHFRLLIYYLAFGITVFTILLSLRRLRHFEKQAEFNTQDSSFKFLYQQYKDLKEKIDSFYITHTMIMGRERTDDHIFGKDAFNSFFNAVTNDYESSSNGRFHSIHSEQVASCLEDFIFLSSQIERSSLHKDQRYAIKRFWQELYNTFFEEGMKEVMKVFYDPKIKIDTPVRNKIYSSNLGSLIRLGDQALSKTPFDISGEIVSLASE